MATKKKVGTYANTIIQERLIYMVWPKKEQRAYVLWPQFIFDVLFPYPPTSSL